MNKRHDIMSQLVGAAGMSIIGIAFVALFSSMGAQGVAQAKAEAHLNAMPVYALNRIEVLGKALPRKDIALNTHTSKSTRAS